MKRRGFRWAGIAVAVARQEGKVPRKTWGYRGPPKVYVPRGHLPRVLVERGYYDDVRRKFHAAAD